MKYLATLNDMETNALGLKKDIRVYSVVYSNFIDYELRVLTMRKIDINSNEIMKFAFQLGNKYYWQFVDENIRRI